MSIDLFKSLCLLAWRNLRRNLRRNLATGIAISAGFTAFLLAAGYANRVEGVLSKYTIYGLKVGHISILRKGALEKYPIRPRLWSLTAEQQSKIEDALGKLPDIEHYGKILTGQGLVGNGCKTLPFIAVGVDLKTERYAMTHPDLLRWAPHVGAGKGGKPLWEYNDGTVPVAISQGLARLLGKTKVLSDFSVPPKLTLVDCQQANARQHFADDANVQLAAGTWDGQLNALDADVVQIYNTGLVETNNSSLTIGLEQLQSLYHTDQVKSYSIWLKDGRPVKKIIEELKSQFGGSDEYDIFPWNHESIGPYYVGTMRFIVTMVAFIGFVLAMVVVLSIFNSATMTVIERSEEVGMLRSLGYTRRLIRSIFALEGFFLTVCGTVVGIVVGLISMLLVNHLGLQFHPPGVEGGLQLLIEPTVSMILLATLSVSSLGVIATWLAVAGLSRKNISQLVAGSFR